ncbi:MAG: hypothetical protein JWM78_2534 [Verrucomicrobiaceae bacterium]|nr:hypothetical protein [Verrucomicrobiaceae bacterium]
MRYARYLLLSFFSVALIACHHSGGSSDSSPQSPPVTPPVTPPVEPPTNTVTTASFTAATSAAQNTAVIFDASTSAAADGGALQYVWDFGGVRGGGKIIARSFAIAGDTTVKLTVIDSAGLSATKTQTITITAPAVAPATKSAQGSVTGLDGTALPGVTVAVVGSSATGTTDSTGKVALTVNVGVPLTVKLSKAGYADQVLSVQVPSSVGADAYFEATMRTRDAAQTLPDAAAGGALTGRDGATITLPANALVDSTGTAVTGPVDIAMTPVDPTQPFGGGFPGEFAGTKPDGSTVSIVSYGTTEYILTAGGQALQLAPGKTASIDIPLYATKSLDGSVLAVGSTTPLWSLDETTGIWVQEGEGTVVASTASPSGLALRATVTHLSWWNSDLGFDPYGPEPKCIYDGDIGIPGAIDTFNAATICNMLAEIDRDLGGNGTTASSGTRRQLATTTNPILAGFSRRKIVAIAGGEVFPVPAGVNIRLSAAVLNGTWTGTKVVNGAVGVLAEEVIKLRPVAGTGPAPEAITLPFDDTRALQPDQVARFTFTGTAIKYARITVSSGNGSTLQGQVRLLQGSTVLGTANFVNTNAPVPLIQNLPADGTYTVEITGTPGAVGTYHAKIEMLGGLQSEALALPISIYSRALPEFTTYRGSFTIGALGAVSFGVTQLGQTSDVRIVGPNGDVYTATSLAYGLVSKIVELPAAGTYTVELGATGGVASNFGLSVQQTAWVPVAPALPLNAVASFNDLVDLTTDRNGKAVVAYVRQYLVTVPGNHYSNNVVLKRWTGTAWEDVASELAINWPCSSAQKAVSVAFDSTNNPVIAYGTNEYLNSGNSSTYVSRYVAGAWQGVGPNSGKLPFDGASASSSSCDQTPVVQIGTDDQPVVAYRFNNDIHVQRYNGSAWGDVVAGNSTFSPSGTQPSYDLRFDASNRLWLAVGVSDPAGQAVVRRLTTAATPTWETIGSNGGVLPETNTMGLYRPQLRFNSAGNPLIGFFASVIGEGGFTFNIGTAVYRYDGSTWSSTGGYHPLGGINPHISNYIASFAVYQDEGVMTWLESDMNPDLNNAPVVQRNTAAGWAPIGAGIGIIPQFYPDSIVRARGSSSVLRVVGSDLYMAVLVNPDVDSQSSLSNIQLVRKVAD